MTYWIKWYYLDSSVYLLPLLGQMGIDIKRKSINNNRVIKEISKCIELQKKHAYMEIKQRNVYV